MRASFVAFGATAAIVIGLTGCASSGGPSDDATPGAGKTIRLGVEGPTQALSYTPLAFAIDTLQKEGYTVDEQLFDDPETLSQSVASAQLDIALTSAGTIFAAADAGAPVQAFLGLSRPDYVMVAKKALTTCESLDGKRLAIHSVEGTTGTLTNKWLADTCPQIKPNIIVVPGSENRIAGLIADQIDASPVDLVSSLQLLAQYPDDYTTIDGYGADDIMASYFYAPTAYLDANADVVQDFTDAYIDSVDAIVKDDTAAKARAKELVPDTDQKIIDEVIDYWVQHDNWAAATGVEPEIAQATVDFFGSTTPYENIKDATTVITDKFAKAHG